MRQRRVSLTLLTVLCNISTSGPDLRFCVTFYVRALGAESKHTDRALCVRVSTEMESREGARFAFR